MKQHHIPNLKNIVFCIISTSTIRLLVLLQNRMMLKENNSEPNTLDFLL